MYAGKFNISNYLMDSKDFCYEYTGHIVLNILFFVYDTKYKFMNRLT